MKSKIQGFLKEASEHPEDFFWIAIDYLAIPLDQSVSKLEEEGYGFLVEIFETAGRKYPNVKFILTAMDYLEGENPTSIPVVNSFRSCAKITFLDAGIVNISEPDNTDRVVQIAIPNFSGEKFWECLNLR